MSKKDDKWDNERLRVKSERTANKCKALVNIVGEAADGYDKSTPLGRRDFHTAVMTAFDKLDNI